MEFTSLEMNAIIRREALKYGVYLGLINVIVLFSLYLFDVTLLASIKVLSASLLITIVFMVFALRNIRKTVGGFWDFKQAFSAALITLVIAGIIGQVFLYILYNFIDPSLTETVKAAAIDQTESMMNSFGVPQEEIDKAIKEIEKKDMSVTLRSTIIQFGGNLVFYAILALIFGAIMKKTRPMFGEQ